MYICTFMYIFNTYICKTESVYCTAQINIVNQLYFNLKKKKRLEWLEGWKFHPVPLTFKEKEVAGDELYNFWTTRFGELPR